MKSQPRPVASVPGSAPLLGRIDRDQLLAAGREFWRWWREQLIALVPSAVRDLITEPQLLAEASDSEICLYRSAHRNVPERVLLRGPQDAVTLPSDAASSRADSMQCDLVLAQTLVLQAPLSLPLEAARNLRRVLAFSMDRYTPFDEPDVYFDYQVTRRDSRKRQLELVLYVVPRTVVDPMIRRLSQLGLATVTVDVAAAQGAAGSRLGVNLLPASAARNLVRRSRLNTVLAVTAVLLLTTTLILPLWNRHQAVARLESELARLRPQVVAAEAVQAEVDARLATIRQINLRKSRVPTALDVLLELTRLMPDDAWAGQVELREGRVRLSGEAVAAAEMVQTLTTSGYFADPRFESPLTQNPKTGRERFVISLAIKGRADVG